MMQKNGYMLGLLATMGFTCDVLLASNKGKEAVCPPLVSDIGECGGVSVVRVVVYNQGDIFGKNARGEYNCFALQSSFDEIDKTFMDLRKELNDRSRNLKLSSQEQDPTNMDDMAKMMKEQHALEIDAKLAQQRYQEQVARMQEDFLREVKAAIEDLAEQYSWELALPIDSRTAVVRGDKIDVTSEIIKFLNNKHRAKQRTKTFGNKPAAKKE
jgi:Skp family chaperone for outer membrane proteins